MPSCGERLRGVLDGYGNFLRQKNLSPGKQQPYLVRWVRRFLLFARQHGDYGFEQTLDLFLAEVGGRVGVKPWQIQQAADAGRVYRYQFRGTEEDGQKGATSRATAADDRSLVRRLREVIRLPHYAQSTEKTYVHWTNRFLAYRQQTGVTGEPTAAGRWHCWLGQGCKSLCVPGEQSTLRQAGTGTRAYPVNKALSGKLALAPLRRRHQHESNGWPTF